MPAQNKQKFDPDNFASDVLKCSILMMTEMHGALSEILKSGDPVEMKQIAEQTLLNVQNIAFSKPLQGGDANA